ncbi:SOS response-associated peptidase [Pedobacter antarcticus]|uniref:SOS response-associated peptidase n=1 Tax=Pedobacter antarcticus TaxID=34086 RepID=UPI00088CC1AC|nr:SOS response-associated peptidase [Pedobacter antarcticus]SDM40196.1 Putative SOS response-associated peptidase YedK [Pedobacter antarcticus]
MCGRYSNSKSVTQIKKEYPFTVKNIIGESFNLAPSQPGYIITADEPEVIQAMHFGLVPFWAKDKKIGFSMINARSETLLEKSAFRPLVQKSKRCLVLADGFYEWEKAGKEKLPYRFVIPIRDLFSFAGLWSRWKDPTTGDPYETFTIITTAANDIVKPIHERMPVILSKSDEKLWLSKDLPIADILSLCDSYPADEMNKFRVSQDVNKVVNNHARLMEPVNSQ